MGIAREWILSWVPAREGTIAAFMFGSLASMKEDDDLPAGSDVDVMVLTTGDAWGWKRLIHQGLSLDCSAGDWSEFREPHGVLGNPYFANHVASGKTVWDREGAWAPVQRQVAARIADPHWRLMRCETAVTDAIDQFAASEQTEAVRARYVRCWMSICTLGAALSNARSQAPTIRRGFVAMRQTLESVGRVDLHERLLDLMRLRTFLPSEVTAAFNETVDAYDRAVAMCEANGVYAPHVNASLRGSTVAGTAAMLEDGYLLEALPWIFWRCVCAYNVLEEFSPDAEKDIWRLRRDHLAARLGLTERWAERREERREVADAVASVARQLATEGVA